MRSSWRHQQPPPPSPPTAHTLPPPPPSSQGHDCPCQTFHFNVYFFVCGKDRTLPESCDGALERDGSFETDQSFLPDAWDRALKRVKAFCQNPGTGLWNGSKLFARILGRGFGTGQSFCQNSGTRLCNGSELFAKILGRGFGTGQSFLPESREWVRSTFCFIHMYVYLEIQLGIRLERTTVCRCWYYLLSVADRCITSACCSEFFRLSMSVVHGTTLCVL